MLFATWCGDTGIKEMAAAGVVPIVLPGATVFLGKVREAVCSMICCTVLL